MGCRVAVLPGRGMAAQDRHSLRLFRKTLWLHHPIAGEVEAEAHFPQARARHDRAEPRLVLGVEQQETAAAGADQLAADGAVGPRQIVVVVDLPDCSCPRAARFLCSQWPCISSAKPRRSPGLQRRLALVAEPLTKCRFSIISWSFCLLRTS